MVHYRRRPECGRKMKAELERSLKESSRSSQKRIRHPNSPLLSNFEDSNADGLPQSHSPAPPSKKRRVYIEEEVDRDALPGQRYTERYPRAGESFGDGKTEWETWRDKDLKDNMEPFAPFSSVDDWQLGDWLMTCGISQKEMNRHLDLPTVSIRLYYTI
jgi:hypothetical protein